MRLDFCNTDEVKDFVLKIMVENTELKEDLEFYRKRFAETWDKYEKVQAELDALRASIPSTVLEVIDEELPFDMIPGKGDSAA